MEKCSLIHLEDAAGDPMIALVNHAKDPHSVELGDIPVPEIGVEGVLLNVQADLGEGPAALIQRKDRPRFHIESNFEEMPLGLSVGGVLKL